MDVLALRTAVETTLVDLLGVYALPNGQSCPAIAVRADGEKLPAGWRVTGMECVLHWQPIPQPLRQYGGQVAFNVWVADLVAWSAAVDLPVATARLLSQWPGSRYSELSFGRNAGPLSGRRVVLPENTAGVS